MAVRSEWEKPNPSRVAAVKDGQLLGYLLGQRHQDPLRGRHIWISLAGHAIAEGASSELYRDLYAFASQRWVDEGYFTHDSLLPSTDSGLIDARMRSASTNLPSSRFWPRQGFLPVAYRLSRLIDHRISWANLPRF